MTQYMKEAVTVREDVHCYLKHGYPLLWPEMAFSKEREETGTNSFHPHHKLQVWIVASEFKIYTIDAP